MLPLVELEKTSDEKVIENRDLPSKETPEKIELEIESEVQKSPELRVAKTPDVNLPAKTPERRYQDGGHTTCVMCQDGGHTTILRLLVPMVVFISQEVCILQYRLITNHVKSIG